MKYASFRYRGGNLGDEIQSLATEQFLPRVDVLIDRETMRSFEATEPHVVVFQGWFAEFPETCFPPAPAIVPVFVGFHVTRDYGAAPYLLAGESLAYLKAHEPIGCRDDGTRRMLERAGVTAYRSLCLTLTFPRRTAPPEDGRVFVVDVTGVRIPAEIRDGAIVETHEAPQGSSEDDKRAEVRRLLDAYRERARLVVTSKLHCALPCLAMGIPVVFFGDPDDYRYGVLRAIGLPIHRIRPGRGISSALWHFAPFRRLWRTRTWRTVDWDPPLLDLEGLKDELRSSVRDELERASAIATGQETSRARAPRAAEPGDRA